MLDYIPNQKIIKINREKVDKVASNGRKYLIAYQDNLYEAMGKLSHTAFKVYLFFLFNKDGFSFAYSPEFIRKQANVCKETARKAFKELQEKGYIISTSRGYEFYEYPKFSASIRPVGEKRQFVDTDTGEIYSYSFEELVSVVGQEKAVEMWGDQNDE